MCGIAGLFGAGFEQEFPLDALAHRGPDHRGEWNSARDRIWLGHRRLSILDVSPEAAQPMSCLDGRYVLAFNGEIYNFLELRSALQSCGYYFRTVGDTEVIAAAYDRWGETCLNRFDGMWALAIWDTRKKSLWLCRDRFGKKPLYYFDNGGTLAFASEIQALHRWLGPAAPLDDAVLACTCNGMFGWHGTDQTYLRDVRSVPAGHFLRRTAEKTELHRWYRLEPRKVPVPHRLEDQAFHLRELLEDSCRLRLRSDVLLATCLSGGLDSATVTAMVHKGLREKTERAAAGAYEAYCAGFPGTMLDEQAGASDLARSLGVKLHVLEIHPPTPEELIAAARQADGPMHALAFYPIWKLYGFIAARGVKVTLDGQGPDEMLGGYFETIRAALISGIRSLSLPRLIDVYRTYAALGETRHQSSRMDARAELIRILKSPLAGVRRMSRRLRSGQPPAPGGELSFPQGVPSGLSPLGAAMYDQFCRLQLPTILQQYDRCSMAHGVECRMPFMDHRVVEFVFSLPDESRVGAGYTKRVLRLAAQGLVPDNTRLNRVKMGFNAPLVEWFSGPLRDWLRDVLSDSRCRQSPHFDGRFIARRFESWLESPSWNQAWQFWPPVHYMLWLDEVRHFGRHDGVRAPVRCA